MNILITAGGTSEQIDHVRSITNHSTGRLGMLIAELFLARGHTVIYITTPHALRPTLCENVIIREIIDTRELEHVLLQFISNQSIDAIIHSMAVSDFRPDSLITQEAFVTELIEELTHCSEALTPNILAEKMEQVLTASKSSLLEAKKISSQSEHLLLSLKKNPKLIAMIRNKQPNTILVGFKLLVGVPEKELLRVGKKILVENSCDFVFANDLDHITDSSHHGFLLDKNGGQRVATTKESIANLIVTSVIEKGEVEP